MRIALWLMALFAVAVATALFAGNNHATVTLFWPPHRVDISLNLFLLLLGAGFVVLHLALRALSALLGMPQQARRWRLLQRERAIYTTLLDALSNLVAGRFVRARKSAELVITLEESVRLGGEVLGYGSRLRALAHLVAAQSAHTLQDRLARDAHYDKALADAAGREAVAVRDGVQLRRAHWALDDQDAGAALHWLDQLPSGVSRRTVALRMRFKAARMGGQYTTALECARLLTKHRAFSEVAGKSIARGLSVELIQSAYDVVQLERAWKSLDLHEQTIADVACAAAHRLLELGGDVETSRLWVTPVWERMLRGEGDLNLPQRIALARVLEQGFDAARESPDVHWLKRIETAQRENPRDAVLQYLAGVVCMRLKLWGKAQQLLQQSLQTLPQSVLTHASWMALAEIAQERQDDAAVAQAYEQAAKSLPG